MTWVAFRALFPATFVFIFGPASKRGPDSQLLYFRERQCCSYRFRSSHEAGGHGLVPACRSFNRGPPAPSSHSFLPGMFVLCTSGRLWIWPGVGGQSSPYTVSLLRRPQSLETRYTCLPSERSCHQSTEGFQPVTPDLARAPVSVPCNPPECNCRLRCCCCDEWRQ
jgi:hypothetical protein